DTVELSLEDPPGSGEALLGERCGHRLDPVGEVAQGDMKSGCREAGTMGGWAVGSRLSAIGYRLSAIRYPLSVIRPVRRLDEGVLTPTGDRLSKYLNWVPRRKKSRLVLIVPPWDRCDDRRLTTAGW